MHAETKVLLTPACLGQVECGLKSASPPADATRASLQNTPDPNPHVLAGAMAGSMLLPGDSFNDNRTDFQITEARL